MKFGQKVKYDTNDSRIISNIISRTKMSQNQKSLGEQFDIRHVKHAKNLEIITKRFLISLTMNDVKTLMLLQFSNGGAVTTLLTIL